MIMTELNEELIREIHNFINYEADNDKGTLTITWDYNNKKINKLMLSEFNGLFLPNDNYFNGLWINEVKTLFNWNKGKSTNIALCHYVFNGKIVVFRYTKNEYNIHNIKIDENGYLCVKPFNDNNIRSNEFVKCNCLYNELLDDENLSYILK